MAPPARRPVECPDTSLSLSALKQGNPYRPCPAASDEDRRNKYARSAQAWLALVAHAAHRRTVTYDALGALLQSHPMTLRSAPTSTPSTTTATSTGSRPWPWSASTKKTGEPSRGNVGIFGPDKNRERVFNYDWFALAPPTSDEIKEAHLAQNPGPIRWLQAEGGRNNSLNTRPGLTSLGNRPGAQTPEGINRQNF